MKKLPFIILIILIINSCKKPSNRDCWKSNGEIISKKTEWNQMSKKIQINDDIDILLINDSTDKIIIEGPNNLINHIEVTDEYGKIIFRNNNRCDFLRKPLPIKIMYHYTSLNLVELHGYGSLTNYDTIYHNLNISALKALSKINLCVNNDSTIFINESGSTNLNISGKCNYFYAFSNGMAPLQAIDLECEKAHGHSSALGEFYINASHTLIIELRSSGNVYYKGDPIQTSFINNGQGEIIKL